MIANDDVLEAIFADDECFVCRERRDVAANARDFVLPHSGAVVAARLRSLWRDCARTFRRLCDLERIASHARLPMCSACLQTVLDIDWLDRTLRESLSSLFSQLGGSTLFSSACKDANAEWDVEVCVEVQFYLGCVESLCFNHFTSIVGKNLQQNFNH